MIVLVDMDGVIANFEKAVLDSYKKKYPKFPYIPLEDRTTYHVKAQYPDEHKPLIDEIYFKPGFYLNLEPIEGSLEALIEMVKLVENVYICTKPMLENKTCIQDKIDWVAKYLGNDWVHRLIFTRDKTVISGDYLIDDRPQVEGIRLPQWEHILFEQPYNKTIEDKRRLNWSNWKDLLL